MNSDRLECGAEWEIWYQDTFDRESPRQMEIAGQGLAEGLTELWARHLYETVQANGQPGFSHFNLWWKQEKISVEVIGEWDAQVRLRGWVYRGKRQMSGRYMEEGDQGLLELIAVTHKTQLLRGKTSEAILAAASASRSREAFMEQLLSLD